MTTHFYKIYLKCIKKFFLTVTLKRTQRDNHFSEEEDVRVGTELQEGETM
jgi:hypothetical protein